MAGVIQHRVNKISREDSGGNLSSLQYDHHSDGTFTTIVLGTDISLYQSLDLNLELCNCGTRRICLCHSTTGFELMMLLFFMNKNVTVISEIAFRFFSSILEVAYMFVYLLYNVVVVQNLFMNENDK